MARQVICREVGLDSTELMGGATDDEVLQQGTQPAMAAYGTDSTACRI